MVRVAALTEGGATGRPQMAVVQNRSSLVGDSLVMRALRGRVERAAAVTSTVLLQGESGTGKELIARELHERGARATAPFIIVDCGSLSSELVASELFGHERGAFTGAETSHIGAFERADGGTLLLDEVGELPTQLQSVLLGAIERRRFRRVGGSREISVNVRVMAATHRELPEAVRTGAFRLDLLYRLSTITLAAPPLRARPDDLEQLVEHFLGATRRVDHFSDAVFDQLRAYRWPGNVRELRNLVESTVAMSEVPSFVDGAGESEPLGATVALPGIEHGYAEARAQVLEHFERHYLGQLLEKKKGNVSAAARHARMDRTHLTELLQRHQLRPARTNGA